MRLNPEVRAKLEGAAKEAQRSFSAELEARIVATCALDRKGLELAQALASQIAQIQKMTGKRWHKDLKTWASVAEMLHVGPIHDFDPDRPQDDEIVDAAFDKLELLQRARSELIDRLADTGIAARNDPDKPSAGQAGIAKLPDPTRSATRLVCEKLDDMQERAHALALLEDILQIDEQVRQADAAFKNQLRGHLEATMAGRKLYRDYLRKEAERKRSLGERYDILHLMEVEL